MALVSTKVANCVLCFFLVLFVLMTFSTYFVINECKYKPNTIVQESQNEDYDYDKEGLGVFLGEAVPFSLPFHNQEDPKLVEYVRSKLVPPAPREQKYFLRLKQYDTSQGQAQLVRQMLNHIRDGFFVECGGGDGEFYSNTLFMEQHLNWTGLLVEAEPNHAKDLLSVHRKAWFSPFCLSLNTSTYQTYLRRKPYKVNDPLWSHFLGKVQNVRPRRSVVVTCVPFYTHILALNVTKVDYFSLDVEGNEVEILESIPFDKVAIDVISVEVEQSRGGKLGVIDTMGIRGYKAIKQFLWDIIFVRKDFKVDSFID